FFVNEADSVDSLVVDNSDAVKDDLTTITAGRITGIGMGPDRVIGGKAEPGGISYSNLEELTVDEGSGADNVVVDSTHTGTTTINTARGAAAVAVRSTSGHTFVNTGDDNDSVNVSSSRVLLGSQIVDPIRGLLTVDGGQGTDTVHVDDTAATADRLLNVTNSTVDGLGFPTVDEVQ